MTRRSLEIAFRHLVRLFMLLVIPPIIGVAVASTLPRAYSCTAGLKALARYTVINTAGFAEANCRSPLIGSPHRIPTAFGCGHALPWLSCTPVVVVWFCCSLMDDAPLRPIGFNKIR